MNVTIRFSHVDAAGIVFYPRYFEILAHHFVNVPWADGPVEMQTDFLRPNRLGDVVALRYEQTDEGWSYTGSLGANEHFQIASIPESASRNASIPGARQVFSTEAMAISSVMTNNSGRMQLSRYFELVSDTVEKWIDRTLGLSFRELHIDRRLGIPTVRFLTRLRALPSFGEEVSIRMQALKIGNKSLVLRSWLMRGNDCLVENDQVLVFVDMQEQELRSIPIPGEFRSLLMEQSNVAT